MIELNNSGRYHVLYKDFYLSIDAEEQGIMTVENVMDFARNAVTSMGMYALVFANDRFNEIVDLLDRFMSPVLGILEMMELVHEAWNIAQARTFPTEMRIRIQDEVRKDFPFVF